MKFTTELSSRLHTFRRLRTKKDRVLYEYLNRSLSSWFGILPDLYKPILPYNTEKYNGQIDEVRIYNYVISPTQVRNLYNMGAPIRYGPVTGSP